MQWGELELVNSAYMQRQQYMMINKALVFVYFILEALIKQLIWAYAKTDICLEIDRGNKNRLCTLHAKWNCLPFLLTPALLELLSGAKLRSRFTGKHPKEELERKTMCLSFGDRNRFVTWAQTKPHSPQVRLLLGYIHGCFSVCLESPQRDLTIVLGPQKYQL